MCALAHYLEDEGVRTTLVALVREHAEAIRPPRALWTTFELGRPLGAPEDAAFQRRVIDAAFGLLDAPDVPTLADYPEDAPPDASQDDEGWACPVSFAQPDAEAPTTFAARLAAEVSQLRPWHETWKRRKGGSGVGAAGVEVEELARYLGAFADGDAPPPPEGARDAADGLKLAVNDLMTFYQEAANAQPGRTGGSAELNAWFWGETAAGAALREARRIGGESDDKRVALVAQRLILPHVAEDIAGR